MQESRDNRSLRILITGSNGFVGGELALLLQAQGHHVTGLGRLPQSRFTVSEYIQHDLAEELAPRKLAQKFDVVVHAAALASPWASPLQYQRNNVDATQNILNYCARYGMPHFVYISSSSIFYTKKDQNKINESTSVPQLSQQINEYSRTKLKGEILTRSYLGSYAILRPRAVFGRGDTVLLPRIIKAAEQNKLPLLFRVDGKKTYGDLISIDTLVDYISKAITLKSTGEINLTNAQPVAVVDFVGDVLKQLNIPWHQRKVPVPLAYIVASIHEFISKWFFKYKEPPVTKFGISVFASTKTFDVSKMLTLLGPPKQSVKEGVEELITWWRLQER